MPEIPIVFLLIFSPLAYGGVTPFGVATIQSVTILAVAWWLLTMIRSGRWRLYRTPLDLPAFAFLSLATLSLTWSIYPYATKIHLHRLYAYAAVFYLIINTIRQPRRLLRLAWLIVMWGAAYASFGLAQPEGFFDRIPYYAPVADQSIERGLRLTFINHTNFACYLEMICCLSLGLALAERGAKRILLFFLAAIMAAAVFASLSRGGMLGLLSGCCFLGLALLRHRKERRAAGWLAGFGLLTAAGMFFLLQSSPILDRLETLKSPLQDSRLAMWSEGLGVIAARPWLGSGLGTYLYASPPHQSEATAQFSIDHPHNEYLERTAELGLVGMALATVWLVLLIRDGLRRLSAQENQAIRWLGTGALAGCVALLVQDIFDFQFAIPSNALLFAICAAVAVLCETFGSKGRLWVHTSSIDSIRPMAQGFLFVSTVFILAVSSQILAGNRHAENAKDSLEAEEFNHATAELEQAIIAEPHNASHFALMGKLLRRRASKAENDEERIRYLAEALNSYDQAINRCPTYSFYHSQRGRILMDFKRIREARETLEQAVRLAPMQAYNHYYLGQFHMNYGDQEQAYAAYRQAINLQPNYYDAVERQLRQFELNPKNIEDALLAKATLLLEYSPSQE